MLIKFRIVGHVLSGEKAKTHFLDYQDGMAWVNLYSNKNYDKCLKVKGCIMNEFMKKTISKLEAELKVLIGHRKNSRMPTRFRKVLEDKITNLKERLGN